MEIDLSGHSHCNRQRKRRGKSARRWWMMMAAVVRRSYSTIRTRSWTEKKLELISPRPVKDSCHSQEVGGERVETAVPVSTLSDPAGENSSLTPSLRHPPPSTPSSSSSSLSAV